MTDVAPEAQSEADDNGVELLTPDAFPNEEAQSAETEGGEQEDDSEELEWEGAKYRAPKALKSAVEKAADYTRKTMELADLRRAFEEEKTAHAGVSAETIKALARVQTLDEQLEQYGKVDWAALQASDPDLANQHRWNQADLREKRAQAVSELQTKEQQRQLETQRETAKQISQAQEALARDIKDWGPEKQAKLKGFGIEAYGFKPEELDAVRDARVIRLLNDAFEGRQAKKTQAAAQAVQRQETVKPTPKVAGGGTARIDPSKMSDAQFKAWANGKGGPLAQMRN